MKVAVDCNPEEWKCWKGVRLIVSGQCGLGEEYIDTVTVIVDDCAQKLEYDSCTYVAQRTLWKRVNDGRGRIIDVRRMSFGWLEAESAVVA